MRAALLSVALVTAAAGCIDKTCTAIFVWGITVDVTGSNNEPIDATVTFRDGDFVDVIESENRIGTVYAGAGERSGTYEVTVEAEGFHSVVVANVRVTENECHVETQRLAVMLEPL